MSFPDPIVPDSYWVDELLGAGEYPGSLDPGDAEARIARFEAAGVDLFLDLTHPSDRLEPYAHLLRHARHTRASIVDMSIPTVEEMATTLGYIDTAGAAGQRVYVHCWGGIGRTGLVIGCWLVRHGSTAEAAIERIRELRRPTPDFALYPVAPQTREQCAFLAAWDVGA